VLLYLISLAVGATAKVQPALCLKMPECDPDRIAAP